MYKHLARYNRREMWVATHKAHLVVRPQGHPHGARALRALLRERREGWRDPRGASGCGGVHSGGQRREKIAPRRLRGRFGSPPFGGVKRPEGSNGQWPQRADREAVRLGRLASEVGDVVDVEDGVEIHIDLVRVLVDAPDLRRTLLDAVRRQFAPSGAKRPEGRGAILGAARKMVPRPRRFGRFGPGGVKRPTAPTAGR